MAKSMHRLNFFNKIIKNTRLSKRISFEHFNSNCYNPTSWTGPFPWKIHQISLLKAIILILTSPNNSKRTITKFNRKCYIFFLNKTGKTKRESFLCSTLLARWFTTCWYKFGQDISFPLLSFSFFNSI